MANETETSYGAVSFRRIGGLPRGALLKIDNVVYQENGHLYILEAPGSLYEGADGGPRYAFCPTPTQVQHIVPNEEPALGPLVLETGTWEIERTPKT